jgi:PHD/YefM family antitoxin component YafN of YafNO toxin-antitoxin module
MIALHPQFITDTAGKKLVVLPQSEFDILMEELDDAEDVRLYDEAKKDNEPSIRLEEAMEMLKAERKKLGK